MKSQVCLAVNPDVILREEGEDAFLFNPEDGNLICVNSLGAFIWKQCDERHTRDKILALIRDDYPDTSEDEITKDFDSFVGQLQEINFLRAKK